MDIYVLDGFDVVDVIDTYESVIWTMQYFGQNDFQLIVAGTDRNVNLLQVGRYLVRDMDMSDGVYKNVMRIQDIKLDFDVEKGWILTVSGKGLKSIVGQRIIWSQTNLNGTVEDGILEVIQDNVISPSDTNRTIPDFTTTTDITNSQEIEAQYLGDNIADWLEEICTTYGYGWDVYIDNGEYTFQLYEGTDRTYDQLTVIPVVFSLEYDNLLSSSYEYNMLEYKNAALVGGEGEGTAQRTATVGTASGFDRYETYVDGGSVSSNGEIITLETYIKMLEEYGTTQLAETAMTQKFSGNIDPDGMYKLNEDFFLGDKVQIVNEKGITAQPRIIEIIYAEDENGLSVVPTFSEWEVND